MIKFKPVDKTDLNCLTTCLATLMNSFGIEYRLMFCNSWQLDYKPLLDSVGTVLNLFYKDCNIEYKSFLDYQEYISYVKQETQLDNPIITYVNSFYLPWHEDYHKTRAFNHFIVVLGYSDIKDECFVHDLRRLEEPQYFDIKPLFYNYTLTPRDVDFDEMTISLDNIFAPKQIKTICLKNKNIKISDKNIIESFNFAKRNVILESCNSLKYNDLISLLQKQMKKKILCSFDEIDGPPGVLYFDYILWLAFGRKNSSSYFLFLKDFFCTNLFDELIKGLTELGDKFYFIRNRCIKGIVKDNCEEAFFESYNSLIEAFTIERILVDLLASINLA